MAGTPRTAARLSWPSARRGDYESFYVKASHPRDPQALWIRYTVHKEAGRAPTGSLWFTLFEAGAGGPRAVKMTLPRARRGGGCVHPDRR